MNAPRPTREPGAGYRRTSAAVILFLAISTIVAFASLGGVVARQRDLASLAERSAAQRSRAERIAYLALGAATGGPGLGGRARLSAAVAEMQAARARVSGDAGDPSERTSLATLDAETGTFLAQARALVADPTDARALAALVASENALALRFDATIAHRAARSARIDVQLDWILGGFLVLQLTSLALGYRFALVPVQDRIATKLDELRERRRQLQSVFYRNPDPAAIYDRSGGLIQINAAYASLLGFAETEIVGRAFASFVVGRSSGDAEAAFARAAAGETVELETRFGARDGETIDLKMLLFPHLVDGEHAGVVSFSKDVRELNRARAHSMLQSRRMSALYAIASKNETTLREQLEATLEFARTELGYTWAAAFDARDESLVTVAVVGEPAPFLDGRVFPVDGSLAERVLEAGDVWELNDVTGSPWAAEMQRRGLPWRSFVAMPIRVAGERFGTFSMCGSAARAAALSNSDRQFVRLVSSLVAATIERTMQANKLDSLAFFDALTSLPNRVLLHERLEELIANSRRSGARFAVHYVDLDFFKGVNDAAGHAVGDEVLRRVAARMQTCVRASTDTVARLSGDEFVVLQPMTDADVQPEKLSARIVEAIERPFVVDGVAHRLGASVGVSIFPLDGRSAHTLLERADQALYRAKREGRNRSIFASVM